MLRSNNVASVDALRTKQEIRKCKDIIAKWNQQAPSPCRDHVSFILNTKGVVLNVWHINSRVVKSAEAARNSTSEYVCELDEFKDGALGGDVRRYLGQAIYDEALKLVNEGAKPTMTGSSTGEWNAADFPIA